MAFRKLRFSRIATWSWLMIANCDDGDRPMPPNRESFIAIAHAHATDVRGSLDPGSRSMLETIPALTQPQLERCFDHTPISKVDGMEAGS